FPSVASGGVTQHIVGGYLRNGVNLDMRTLQTSSYRGDLIPPRVLVATDLTLARPAFVDAGFASLNSLPPANIVMRYRSTPTVNLIQRDVLTLVNVNGQTADIYYK